MSRTEIEFIVIASTIIITHAQQNLQRSSRQMMTAHDYQMLMGAFTIIVLLTCHPNRPELMYKLTIADFEFMVKHKMTSTTSYKGKNSNTDKDPLIIVWNDVATFAGSIILLVRREYFEDGRQLRHSNLTIFSVYSYAEYGRDYILSIFTLYSDYIFTRNHTHQDKTDT
jgi:hypothetical protein